MYAPLTDKGLNLVAVFALEALPPDLVAALELSDDERRRFRQLILIGHQGRGLWTALQRRGMHGAHPVDQFVTEAVSAWMQVQHGGRDWQPMFPGMRSVPLQRLGALAGWHQRSPFWLGVDAEWGSWFAYRAVLLADTDLPLTPPRAMPSPCQSCTRKPCISACPVDALNSQKDEGTRLQACLHYRTQPGSPCAAQCLARNACPVGAEHRYDTAQTAYHYLQSLPAIRAIHTPPPCTEF